MAILSSCFLAACSSGNVGPSWNLIGNEAGARSYPEPFDPNYGPKGRNSRPSVTREDLGEIRHPRGDTRKMAARGLKNVRGRVIVRQGDTLYSIARRTDTSVGHLVEINQLQGTRIYAGQWLRLH
ncbi:MAG: LysM peptidoglycan-binding domain-containing protein [Alphaproteobacteria bacterium]|nr:LysM peptidoglycan-binding domain-containing protein [Alphaproteobacteria bacterium]